MRIVDGSFYLPAQKRDPKAEFAQQHIPGAVFFDIDEIADTTSPLPHMLPSPEKFSARVRKLGLGRRQQDRDLRHHADDRRLPRLVDVPRHGPQGRGRPDGGLPKWMSEGRPVTDDPTPPRERHFTSRLDNYAGALGRRRVRT